jgi:heat shock protein HtpX
MQGAVGARRAPSLWGRFAAAVALTVGFYVLAVAIASALIGLPIYGWVTAGRGNIWITIFGLVTGVSILAAIVPRRLPFSPPGPRISPADQPRLMAAVEEVARSTGQAMPDETYVTLEANAAVTEVSNGLRRGRRRVLIVGLPLLHLLSERELRGVVAHEFGHYGGGDTRLGPWIWRTRETIERTVALLTDDEDDSWSQRAVRAPFIWYGKAFLRITSAISRPQEFAADAVAAREVGRDAHVEALRRVHAFAPGFDAYWDHEVAPVLSSGYRPPVLAGFAGFAANERIQRIAAAHLEQELQEARADAYDSHPTLPERIAAVAGCAAGPPDDSPPADSLIDGPEALEAAAIAASCGAEAAALPPVRWEDVAERVWLANCRHVVGSRRGALEGRTAGELGELAADPARPANTDELLSASLALAMVGAGWRAEGLPGDPLSVVRGDERVAPVEVVAALAAGDMDPDAWRRRTVALGIDDAPLAEPEPEPAVS